MEQTYRISNLQIENIKKIKIVDITPKNDLVIIEGQNRAGKTSIMDSISYLLGGKTLISILLFIYSCISNIPEH